MGLAQQSFGAGLEHGPAALFDLWLPASQLGKEIIHFLPHCGLGAHVPRQLYLPVGVNQFCRFTSLAWPRCWAALVR